MNRLPIPERFEHVAPWWKDVGYELVMLGMIHCLAQSEDHELFNYCCEP